MTHESNTRHMLQWYSHYIYGLLITLHNLPSRGNVLAVGISSTFGVTVSIPAFDSVLPARLDASQWYMLEFCAFWTERRTKYDMLSFWIRVALKRRELFLSQLISGGGEPEAPHLKIASFPSSSTTSSGWIENTGFQITVVKNDNPINYHIILNEGDRKLSLSLTILA